MVQQNEREIEVLRVPNDEGGEDEFEILSYFENPDTGIKYIFLIPYEEEGYGEEEKEVIAYRYAENGDEVFLDEIESDEEWDMLEEVFATLMEEEGT